MTQEEKAKAYDEAIERARKRYKECLEQGVVGMAENFAMVFPELQESEDERIRKMLVELVKNCGELNFTEVSREAALAYLEKHKEQKPVEWSEEDENKIKDIIDYLECWDDFDHGSESFEEYRKRMEGNIRFMKSLRPQLKQEWSEEDEAELNNILTFIKKDIPISGDTRREFYAWLKSLKPKK